MQPEHVMLSFSVDETNTNNSNFYLALEVLRIR